MDETQTKFKYLKALSGQLRISMTIPISMENWVPEERYVSLSDTQNNQRDTFS
ncbi:uncharacterized protein G2W53_044999 [Senna tora]|uniref:Uncharacterized protein n=1 Tax=Senna tora TaxID=362788 RepID=A0A834VY41_9FABA|nr:uncharacterized protein G2W53_044999 [Senna tora]